MVAKTGIAVGKRQKTINTHTQKMTEEEVLVIMHTGRQVPFDVVGCIVAMGYSDTL